MDNLKWYWVYVPYLDPPDRQQESALRAGYNKVCFKYDADIEIRTAKRALWLARANYCHNFRVDWYISRHPHSKMRQSVMENTLIMAEMNCRAKADEYK